LAGDELLEEFAIAPFACALHGGEPADVLQDAVQRLVGHARPPVRFNVALSERVVTARPDLARGFLLSGRGSRVNWRGEWGRWVVSVSFPRSAWEREVMLALLRLHSRFSW